MGNSKNVIERIIEKLRQFQKKSKGNIEYVATSMNILKLFQLSSDWFESLASFSSQT